MSDLNTGSCKCNAIRYEVKGPLKFATNCHCNLCKKLTGGPFSSIVVVSEADFEVIDGSAELTRYQISDLAEKHFCRICGTPIFNRHSKFSGQIMLTLGSLDHPRQASPKVNVHCENMLPWIITIDQMKNFYQNPPE